MPSSTCGIVPLGIQSTYRYSTLVLFCGLSDDATSMLYPSLGRFGEPIEQLRWIGRSRGLSVPCQLACTHVLSSNLVPSHSSLTLFSQKAVKQEMLCL